jgi:hypothetical protein
MTIVVSNNVTNVQVSDSAAARSDRLLAEAAAATATGVVPTTTGIIRATNIAALRTNTPVANQVAVVSGYYSNGDGGGGEFYGVTGGSYTDDGALTIVPGGGTGTTAWKRIVTGPLNVKWFGAKGDGSNDDTSAIQAAIDVATVKVQTVIASKVDFVSNDVFVPAGVYKHLSTIYVKEGVRLIGASKSSSMLQSAGLAVAVQMGGVDREYSNVMLEHLSIKGDGSTNTTKGVYFTGTIRNCYIQQCQIYGFGYNIYGYETWAFTIADNYIHDALKNNIWWSAATACEIARNRIDDAGEECIVLDGGASEIITVNLTGNAIQGAQYNGVKVVDGTNIRFENNFFERNNFAGSTYADVLLIPGGSSTTTTVAVFTGNFYTQASAPGTTHRAIDIRKADNVYIIGDQVRGSGFEKAIILASTVGYAYVRGSFSIGGANIIDSDPATVLDWVDGNYQQVIGESPTAIAKTLTIKDAKANSSLVHYENSSSTTGSITIQAKAGTTDTNTYLAYWLNSSGTNVFRVTANGDTRNANNVFGSISDAKLKDIIGPASSQWEDIKAVNLCKFRFKSDESGLVQLGVIAQELEKTSPNLVSETPDFEEIEIVNEAGQKEIVRRATGETTKEVKYSILYLKALGALQEAMRRIEGLEQKVKS